MRSFLLTFAFMGIAGFANAATIDEMTELQVELDKAEYRSKLLEKRKPEQQQMQISSKPQHDPIVLLKGVYGVSGRLYAIVTIDGAEVEFAARDTRMGFRAKEVSADEVILVKLDNKGSDRNGKVYRLHLTGGGANPNQALPPLPAVPAGAPFHPVNVPANQPAGLIN